MKNMKIHEGLSPVAKDPVRSRIRRSSQAAPVCGCCGRPVSSNSVWSTSRPCPHGERLGYTALGPAGERQPIKSETSIRLISKLKRPIAQQKQAVLQDPGGHRAGSSLPERWPTKGFPPQAGTRSVAERRPPHKPDLTDACQPSCSSWFKTSFAPWRLCVRLKW